jgi:hypothetical protein
MGGLSVSYTFDFRYAMEFVVAHFALSRGLSAVQQNL